MQKLDPLLVRRAWAAADHDWHRSLCAHMQFLCTNMFRQAGMQTDRHTSTDRPTHNCMARRASCASGSCPLLRYVCDSGDTPKVCVSPVDSFIHTLGGCPNSQLRCQCPSQAMKATTATAAFHQIGCQSKDTSMMVYSTLHKHLDQTSMLCRPSSIACWTPTNSYPYLMMRAQVHCLVAGS